MTLCPKCANDMSPVSHEGVTVDRCSSCGGIWLDARKRDALLAAKGGARAVDTGDAKVGRKMNQMGRVPCPRCEDRMIRMADAHHNVQFEHCPACGGIFLDAGELRELSRAARSEDALRAFLMGVSSGLGSSWSGGS